MLNSIPNVLVHLRNINLKSMSKHLPVNKYTKNGMRKEGIYCTVEKPARHRLSPRARLTGRLTSAVMNHMDTVMIRS
jgi:hypothetical protein